MCGIRKSRRKFETLIYGVACVYVRVICDKFIFIRIFFVKLEYFSERYTERNALGKFTINVKKLLYSIGTLG